jgi:hypothetical protein
MKKIQILKNSKPLFKTQEEYQQFCDRFTAEVTTELDRQRIASLLSEEDAKHHLVD